MIETRVTSADGAADVPFTAIATTTCSIARTAELIGQPWMLVVVRDLGHGVSRFERLVEHLGIAPAVLTKRLQALVAAGLVERVAYREAGQRARAEYVLTAVGRQLRQVLLAAMNFGDDHLAGSAGAPLLATHDGCGAAVRMRPVCEHGHVLGADDRIVERVGPGALLT